MIFPILSFIVYTIGYTQKWTILLNENGWLFFYKGRNNKLYRQLEYENTINNLIKLETKGDIDSGYIEELSFVFSDKKVTFNIYALNPEYRISAASFIPAAKFFKSLLNLQKEIISKKSYSYNNLLDNETSMKICHQYFYD